MPSRININADDLRVFIAELFQRLDLPAQDARTAADVLVRAELRGVETHGINNIDRYVDGLRSGDLNPKPEITVVRESPTGALLDGDRGLGMVIGVRAMEHCIAKAKERGMSIVVVRRSSHFGMTSYYPMMCLPHDMIGVALTNNAYPLMLPTFGREPMLDTNPISIVAPASKEPPFVLDMATSVAAFGKIVLATVRDEKIPVGWALDKQGRATDDPRTAVEARKLIPLGGPDKQLGGHKGYGLAVAVDILTGILASGTYGDLALRNPLADENLRSSSSHFFMALAIDWFRPAEEFKSAMDDMLRALKNSAKAEGHDRIYTHGEIEFETEQERVRTGIPCYEPHVRRLRELGREFDIPLGI